MTTEYSDYADTINPFAFPEDLFDDPKVDDYYVEQSVSLFPPRSFDKERDLPIENLFKTLDLHKEQSLFQESPFVLPLTFKDDAAFKHHQPSPLPTTKEVENTQADQSTDLWLNPTVSAPATEPRFSNWDTFLVHAAGDPRNPYLTESSSKTIDAAIAFYLDDIYSPNESGYVIRSDLFCYVCVRFLYLPFPPDLAHDYSVSRTSLLAENLYCSDLTRQGLASSQLEQMYECQGRHITSFFINCGNNQKKLQAFAKNVYQDHRNKDSVRVALADCVNTTLRAVQERISIFKRDNISVIDLQNSIQESALVLQCLNTIIEEVGQCQECCILLSKIFQVVQKLEYKIAWLRPFLLAVLAKTTSPWLRTISEWIGLFRIAPSNDDTFFLEQGMFMAPMVILDDGGGEVVEINEMIFDPLKVPSFINQDDAESIFETGKALRILSRTHKDHPLLQGPTGLNNAAPKLEWKFSWEDIERIQVQATSYENSVREAVQRYNDGKLEYDLGLHLVTLDEEILHLSVFGPTKSDPTIEIANSIQLFNQNPPNQPLIMTCTEDNLHSIASLISPVSDEVNHLTNYAPPLSITPIMSFSHILSVQSRLTNAASMRLFFEEHKIQAHFSLLRQFFLFGDGVFVSRLQHALFDDELGSADQREGTLMGSSMGLKLGSRDSWPPASSELRLALMDVLIDCYRLNKASREEMKDPSSISMGDLPGGLSFMIRDMDEDELHECMNPDSIQAMDFLRLQYRPPSPLDAVINRGVLQKYDKLFKLLLRVIRMLYVINQLFRDTISRPSNSDSIYSTIYKFRTEAHHFISSLAKYLFESGVGAIWDQFERMLKNMEDQISQGHCYDSLGTLSKYHESVLDRMLFATFSRKRQAPIMAVIKEIYGIVLAFAKHMRMYRIDATPHTGRVLDGSLLNSELIEELYSKLRKRVAIFITVCRGLNDKRGYGEGVGPVRTNTDAHATTFTSDVEEGGSLGQLLIKLEMTGYYLKQAKRK